MSLSTASNRVVATGDGVTTIFYFNRLLYDADRLEVYVGGVLQSSGYTVNGVPGTATSVTFSVAPAASDQIILLRVLPRRARPRSSSPPRIATSALAFDSRGALYVATGAEGRVDRVEKGGKSEVVLASAYAHLTALAFDAKANLYAGSSPGGILAPRQPGSRSSAMVR